MIWPYFYGRTAGSGYTFLEHQGKAWCLHRRSADESVQPECGLICTTKVLAKHIFVIVGGLILMAGFFSEFGALMATILQPVLGGLAVTVFTAITMSGIQLLGEQTLNYRNKMIVSIALEIGVRIESVPSIRQYLSQLARNVIGSSLMVSFLIVFVLNLIVPEYNSPVESKEYNSPAESKQGNSPVE